MSGTSATMPESSISAYPFRNAEHFLQASLSYPNELHAMMQEIWANTPLLPTTRSQLQDLATRIPSSQDSADQLLRRLHIVAAQQMQAFLEDATYRQAFDEEVKKEGKRMRENGKEAYEGRPMATSSTKSNSTSKLRSTVEHDNRDGSEYVEKDTKEYCFCRSVSSGIMVECENGQCPYEWFHLNCVGLARAPAESVVWYCPECRERSGMRKKTN